MTTIASRGAAVPRSAKVAAPLTINVCPHVWWLLSSLTSSWRTSTLFLLFSCNEAVLHKGRHADHSGIHDHAQVKKNPLWATYPEQPSGGAKGYGNSTKCIPLLEVYPYLMSERECTLGQSRTLTYLGCARGSSKERAQERGFRHFCMELCVPLWSAARADSSRLKKPAVSLQRIQNISASLP